MTMQLAVIHCPRLRLTIPHLILASFRPYRAQFSLSAKVCRSHRCATVVAGMNMGGPREEYTMNSDQLDSESGRTSVAFASSAGASHLPPKDRPEQERVLRRASRARQFDYYGTVPAVRIVGRQSPARSSNRSTQGGYFAPRYDPDQERLSMLVSNTDISERVV